jgi:hypothetical protein
MARQNGCAQSCGCLVAMAVLIPLAFAVVVMVLGSSGIGK